MNKTKSRSTARMRAEYDFRAGIRGKYAQRFAAGSNIVVLDPDVARAFPDARKINAILRALVEGMARVPRGPRRG